MSDINEADNISNNTSAYFRDKMRKKRRTKNHNKCKAEQKKKNK